MRMRAQNKNKKLNEKIRKIKTQRNENETETVNSTGDYPLVAISFPVVLPPVCSLLLDPEMRFVVDLRLLAGQHHAIHQDPAQQLLLNCLWLLDDTVL